MMPICFDLDGTLGHFSSGFLLLREALGGLWGTAPTVEDLGQCQGSTDWEIVDELHLRRFGKALDETGYAAYETACVARFREVFAPITAAIAPGTGAFAPMTGAFAPMTGAFAPITEAFAPMTGAFGPGAREAVGYAGVLEGMHRLAASHRVCLVSGNAPGLLAFKAGILGIDAAIPRLGSLPRHNRTDLLKAALHGCPGPHLYVGDRPHDLAAARAAGLPFLGIGSMVPGDHVSLGSDVAAEHLIVAVEAALATRS